MNGYFLFWNGEAINFNTSTLYATLRPNAAC